MRRRGYSLVASPLQRGMEGQPTNAECPVLSIEEGAPGVLRGFQCYFYSSVPVVALTASDLVPNSAIQWGAGLAVTASDSSISEHRAL